MKIRLLTTTITAALSMLTSGVASAAVPGPLNDLLALGQGTGQTPLTVPLARRAEPPLQATPRAQCVSGGRREPGIQGRVPSSFAHTGLSCNAELLAHQGVAGGFKVLRYVDPAGHECAYYDTALLYPLNALRLDSSSTGVVVLDMSDPRHPVETDRLTALPMLSPHESLVLNAKRGLLGAVLGNPATYPGLVSLYDLHRDCRHPVEQSTALVARFGHEAAFSPDGNTFYATGLAVQSITAIDVTNPQAPTPIWQGNVYAHGLSLSDDGNRAYIADPGLSGRGSSGLLILDTSEIQARKPNPQVYEISRLTWGSASIPQNAYRFTSHGHPYLLEFDEYTAGVSPFGVGGTDTVGAARIIDIADERAPRVVSNLRLQVQQHDDHHAAAGDFGTQNPVQGYANHYCDLDSPVDPKVVACSMIASGLRVFDITDVTAPKEIAYYVAPTKPVAENGFLESDYAMSKPVIVPARHEVWYTDGASGFYALHIDDRVWPRDCDQSATVAITSLRASRRGITVRGTATRGCAADTTVRRVDVAVALMAGRRCAFLTPDDHFTRPRSCRTPVTIGAHGTAQWSIARHAGLRRGSYRLYVYTTTDPGRPTAPVEATARFRVR